MSGQDRAHGRTLGFERLLFFSDAVFAIAITLLVLDLRPADTVQGGVIHWAALAPKLVGFGLSFYVIGQYWIAHHGLFEGVSGYDPRLLAANLWFLAAVAFVPFPTSVVIDSPPGHGPVALYAGSLALAGLAMVALALIARRPALLRPGETRGGTARAVAAAAGAPAVFLVAFGLAWINGRAALWSLLLLIPVGAVTPRLGAALERRLDAAGQPG